jgi:hypothetical protein
MQFATFYAAAGALLGALAGILLYHAAVARPATARTRRLLDLHDNILAGGAGSAADRIGALEEGQASARAELQRVADRIRELETLAASDLSRAGFVRYDAFAGSGSGLSYALALLNRRGDGVVITSIYSRDDTRTFGKAVSGFKPTVHASAEELEAIERARPPAS